VIRLRGDLSGVAMMSPEGYRSLYNTPGRAYNNACRTKQNPEGWEIGSGGNAYPTPLDIDWTPAEWTAQGFDNLIAGAERNRATGQYSCPTGDAAIAASVAASPFYHPPSDLPAGSPYGVTTEKTPLLPSWSGGLVTTPPVPAGGPNAGAPAPGAGPVLTPVVKTGSSSGFSLSSVPWWGWAAAAAGVYYATKGK
jgi:hypothetical protein